MYTMILSRCLLFGLIILAMFATENQGQKAKKRKNKVKVELDPATAHILKILRNQKGKHLRNVRATVAPSNPSSQLIEDYISIKFKSEIVKLFTYLPHKQRCNIINDIMNVTLCDNAFILSMLIQNNTVRDPTSVKCSIVRTSRCSESKNAEKVLRVFWDQMGKLFQGLPLPFQCSIVNKISSTSPISKRRKLRQSPVLKDKKPRITLKLVERQLEKLYPDLDITQKCSKVWKPLKKKVPLESPASLINVTVEITQGTKRKEWITRLRKKAFKIYNIYYKYSMKEQRRRPLTFFGGRQSTGLPLLKKKQVRLTISRKTKVSRFAVSVVFALGYKKSETSQLVNFSQAKKIIKAINMTGAVAMRRLFNARVLELTVAKAEPDHVNGVWTSQDMAKAQRLFPHYLISYYRLGIDRLARCLVMLYISTNLQRNLRPVEVYYNSRNYLPKKYFCSSTRRASVTNVSVGSFYRINDTDRNPFSPKPTEKLLLVDRINERMTVTSSEEPKQSTKEQDEDEHEIEVDGPVEERSTTRNMTPLEIGLVAVLAVLCVAILSFTIYCVVFAFRKRRPAPTDHQPAKTSFELFRKIEVGNKLDAIAPNVTLPKRENGVRELTPSSRRLGVLIEEVPKPEPQNVSHPNVYTIAPQRSNQEDCRDEISQDVALKIVGRGKENTDGNYCNDHEDDDHSGDDADDDDDQDTNFNNEAEDDHKDINDINSITHNDNGDVIVDDDNKDDDVFYKQTSPENTNSAQDLNSDSLAQRNCSTNQIHHDRPRTLKESCGEMIVISDNHLSLSNSGDLDPVIKNNTMTVVVVIDDQDSERESSA